MLSELTPVDWAVQTLLAAPAIAAIFGARIDADDNVPPMEDGEAPAAYFPRLVYDGDPHGTNWADGLDLGYGDYLFKAVMREDALAPGVDLKSFTGAAAAAIATALVGAPEPGRLGNGRMIHGCAVIDIFSAPIYGADGQRFCERGRFFRLLWT